MVAQFGDSQLVPKNPCSTDDFKGFPRHTCRKIDGAEFLLDSDMSYLAGTESDFVDDCTYEIPRFDAVNSTDFHAEGFGRSAVAIERHPGPLRTWISPRVAIVAIVAIKSVVAVEAIASLWTVVARAASQKSLG
jgi:hypothetical protein